MNHSTITTINGVEIITVEKDNEVYVPIKPICLAIGVDPEGQRQRILRHYILKSVAFTLKATGADGKSYEMFCIQLEYVYGWIFTIDANLVSEDNRKDVAEYQRECYAALYRHFAGSLRRRLEENEAEIKALAAVNVAILREKEARAERRKAEDELANIRASRLDTKPRLF